MKRILGVLLALAALGAQAQTFTANNLTVNGTATLTNALAIGSGGTGANTPAGALAALGAAPAITANTTLNVPAQYASIQAACDYLSTATISKNVMVTIQVADGTYNWQGIECRFPFGDQVQVIGDTANPANAVINVNNANSASAFQFFRGHRLNLIDGFTINGTTGWQSHGVWATGTYGAAFLGVDSGSGAQLGRHLVISKMYYGILADHGASFSVVPGSGGFSVNEAGDVGMLARWGGTIDAQTTTVTNSADCQGGTPIAGGCTGGIGALGFGYMAEAGGSMRADYSTTSGNLIGGFVAQSGGSAWYHNVTVSNSNFNLYTNEGGELEAQNSTSTGGAQGAFANNNSYMSIPGSTLSGNTGSGVSAVGQSVINIGTGTNANNNANGFTQYNNSTILGTPGGTGNTFNLFFNGNTLDAVPIGQTTPAAGTFTTLYSTGAVQLATASANHLQIDGATTTNAPHLYAAGSDANINFIISSKGNYGVMLGTGSGAQMIVKDTPGVTNMVSVTGSNGGAPQIGASGGPGLGLNTPIFLNGYTVSTLPTCNATMKGAIANVSDASSPAFNATVAGGGSVETMVQCNGTNWTAH